MFLRLGVTAFGGPAAHIAMMQDEVVERRKWLSNEHFLDLVGATNLIPGPNSSEMAIHIGYTYAGWAGLLVGGLSFSLPAILIVLGLSWAYVRFGTTPAANWPLYGIKPVVIPIIGLALWRLGRKAVKNPLTGTIAVAVPAIYLLLGYTNAIVLLVAGGLVGMLIANAPRLPKQGPAALIGPLAGLSLPVLAAAPFSLGLMFLAFLKIGLVLYGSGYTLFAFLQADFVTQLGWLTEQQLIDAIAVGQVTPGPVVTTATFIGYLLGGVPGALLATLGIYIPSYIAVAISNPLISRVRESTWAASLLDGVNAAALGLMAAVTWQLARAALIDIPTIVIGLVAGVLLFRFKVNSMWLIAGGVAAGVLSGLVR